MTAIKPLAMAIIGDEGLVSGFRLAGVSRCHTVGENSAGEDVRAALTGLLGEPDIGIIVILEDYVSYVEDLLLQIKGEKRMTPIVVEVPSRRGTEYETAGEYYAEYIKRFIGFEIVI